MPQIDIDRYRRDGFLHLPGFFDRQMIEEIRREAKQVFLMQLRRDVAAGRIALEPSEEDFERMLFEYFRRDMAGFANCGKQIQHLISLHRLSLEERIRGTLVQLGLEFPNICTRPVLFFNSRHLATKEIYWRVFAHQDWRSMQGSLNSVVVWLPLCDIRRELGALEIVPGSHRLGLITSEVVERFGKVDGIDEQAFEPVEVRQGDALFFSAFLVHRSGTNSTESIRWSCHFRYNDLAEPTFVERGYPHPYVYQPTEELLTPNFPTVQQVRRIFERTEMQNRDRQQQPKDAA